MACGHVDGIVVLKPSMQVFSFSVYAFIFCQFSYYKIGFCFHHRDLNRSDSDSSLSLSQVSDRLSTYGSKGHLIKPMSLMHGLSGRGDDAVSLHAHTPNGGNRVHEAEPIDVYGLQKSPSLGEINSLSESSRSLSPNSTEPDTPSPMGGGQQLGLRGNTRIPQLSSRKSPLEEDSGSTGEETDSTANRKKHTFKIFKKQKK